MRPHIHAAAHPDQQELQVAVDAALSVAMRRILHHPDFQALEALWRCVDLLVRELPTDTNLQIVLYDISAEELAADLSTAESLDSTGLYQWLVEQPTLDTRTCPPSAIIGNFVFEHTPPHAELLGRMAKIAAAARAPFISAIGNDVLEKKSPDEIHPLVTSSWHALKSLPHAAYLGLTVPRFMLRWPYGAKTEPIDPFDFEEFTAQFGLKGFLWGNGANLAGLMLGRTFAEQGLEGMELGTIMVQGDLPLYYFTDSDGDQVALPCTERLTTESVVARAVAQGFMPLCWLRGRNEVRLGSLQSLAGGPLAGPWGPVDVGEERASPSPLVVAGTEPAPQAAPPSDEVPDVEEVAQAADEDENAYEADVDEVVAEEVVGDVECNAERVDNDESSGDDLDALLASLESPPEIEEGSAAEGDGMDPDLAALLAEL